MFSTLPTTETVRAEIEARHPELHGAEAEQRQWNHRIRRSVEALRRISR